MRRTAVRSLSLLSLFFFFQWAAASSPAPTYTPWKCSLNDPSCALEELAEVQRSYEAEVATHGIDFTDSVGLDLESGLVRLDPGLSLYHNEVHCWPSVGGIIVADRVSAVELEYIGLDRFHTTPRSFNQSEEDAFCMQLRKIGGKWWTDYYDYVTAGKVRKTWPDEREVLFLGWPEQGGVWVLRYEHQKKVRGDLGPVWNALNMEERCRALENRGAVFFERPEESEVMAPLLQGFGKTTRRDPEYEDGGWYDSNYEL